MNKNISRLSVVMTANDNTSDDNNIISMFWDIFVDRVKCKCVMFYGHCCAQSRLNVPSEVKDETPYRHANRATS